MKNDSTSNFALVGIYRTFAAVSALIISLSVSAVYAADPPVPRSNVSVNVNPATSYYTTTNSTLRLPDGVRVSPDTRVAPVVSKYPAGLQQTIPTGITIDAIKKSAPLPVVVRSTTQSVKSAAGRCLKSGRCNVGLILAGEGLNRLFDGLDWVMGEGSKIQKREFSAPEGMNTGITLPYGTNNTALRMTHSAACPAANTPITFFTRNGVPSFYLACFARSNHRYSCPVSQKGENFKGIYANRCVYGGGFPDYFEDRSVDLTPSEIESGVDSNYTPEPSDWPALTPELKLDDVEITSAPTLQGEPKTTTVYDAEGNPHKVTETNIWYDFDIRDNPSPRPSLDMKTREETKTYENGELTGTTTTESTTSGGSAGSPEPPPESPIDCDLFPTACAWFDWTQEEPTEPDDDLSGLLQEVPIVSETYTITGGVAACPAPMVLDLSVFGSREVSYQPLCDLASTMKYLYLALMSFAAAVLLNRSVNRV